MLVFDLIEMSKLSNLDRSLHRHFVQQIIKTIFDPLPDDFVCLVFKLLGNACILAAIRNDADTARMVVKFVNSHKSVATTEAQNILTQLNGK